MAKAKSVAVAVQEPQAADARLALDPDFINEHFMCQNGEWYRFLIPDVDLIPPGGMYEYLLTEDGKTPDPMTGEWVGGYDLFAGALVEASHNKRRIRIAKPKDVNVAPEVLDTKAASA